MDFSTNTFAEAYDLLCASLLKANKVQNTREIINARFEISDISSAHISARNISVRYALAELIWYMSGSNDVDFIGEFAPFWYKISDDNVTSNSAYGYIIQHKYGFDQLAKVIQLLKKDSFSRRGVININCANENVIETKDEPCTIMLQFYVRNSKVHCSAVMRSNDIWRGLPYDIVFFTTLQKIVANALGYKPGSYTHYAVSLHVYDDDLSKIIDCIKPDREIKHFDLDFKPLAINAKWLRWYVNNDNIVSVCKKLNIVKGDV